MLGSEALNERTGEKLLDKFEEELLKPNQMLFFVVGHHISRSRSRIGGHIVSHRVKWGREVIALARFDETSSTHLTIVNLLEEALKQRLRSLEFLVARPCISVHNVIERIELPCPFDEFRVCEYRVYGWTASLIPLPVHETRKIPQCFLVQPARTGKRASDRVSKVSNHAVVHLTDELWIFRERIYYSHDIVGFRGVALAGFFEETLFRDSILSIVIETIVKELQFLVRVRIIGHGWVIIRRSVTLQLTCHE